MVSDPKTVIGGEPFRGVLFPACQFAGARKGRARFRRLMSLGPNQRIAEACLQTQPVAARRVARRRPGAGGELVGQFDRLAEMGGGFLEG